MIGLVAVALIPVALLIGLGWGLRTSGFIAAPFWPQAERLSYYVLLPALFVYGLASADLGTLPVRGIAVTLISATALVAALLVAARRLVPVDDEAFTSVFQGAIRFNNYIGVTLAAGLYGREGIAFAALCNAAIVPTVNLLCILVFARYGSARLSLAGILRQIFTNPLVVACAIGIALQAAQLHLPGWLAPAVQALGTASMPLGLLCVGAALDFAAARRWIGPVLLASAVKFVVMPAVTFAIARLVGLGPVPTVVVLMFQTLPTASSSYIMARQLGGDAPLMAGITALQTVIGLLALPVVLALLTG